MAITWTQVAGTALSINASDAWTDYNIASINSVPAGSVAFIVAANGADAANNLMGVRTNGSSIDRYLNMSEAEDGGFNTIGWYVKVANDGYIEYYTGDHTDTAFYLMGYWSGVDYTEYFAELAFTTSGGTYANNHFSMSSYSPAAGRVCTFALCNNRATTKESAGVRCGDAIYNKTISIHEAESGGVFGVFMATKTDASNQIEYYVESTTYVDVYVTGVFDGLMSYVDRHVDNCYVSITSANTWTDMDCSSYIGADGQVVDCVVMHNQVGAEVNVGVRTNGTSDARYLSACEAESNGYCGWTGPTQTDASGIIEFYSSDASYELMGINGYYVPATIVEKTATESIGVSDATKNGKDLKASESIGSADSTAISKDFRVSESIGTVDVSPLGKALKSAESVSLADSRLLSKALKVAESLGVTDSMKLTKAVLLADAVHATDAVTLAKLIKLTDNISLAEIVALIRYLSFKTTDTVGLSDTTKTSKTMRVADTVGLVDANKLIKALMLAETIGVTDAPKLIKTLKITDAVGVADITKLIKALKATDSVTVAETLLDVVKHFVTSESVSLAEAVAFVKAVVASESISAEDLKSLTKGIIMKDRVGAFDDPHGASAYFSGLQDGRHVDRVIDVPYVVGGLTTNFTLEFWMSFKASHRWDSNSLIYDAHAGLFSGLNGTGNYIWIAPGTTKSLRTDLNLTGSQVSRSSYLPISITDEAWHHYAITYDGTTLKYLLDGAEFGSFSVSGYLRSGGFSFRIGNVTTYWLEGKVSDVRVWNVTKDSTELLAKMNHRLEGNESGLIFYMPLDDRVTPTVDKVGGKNGKALNMDWAQDLPPTMERFEASWDTSPLTFQKDLKQAEAVQVEDSNKLAKAMLVAEALHATDAKVLTKYAKVIEAVTSSDTNKLSKSLKVSESISLSDSLKLLKAILVAQAIGVADSAIVQSLANYQAFQVSESIGVSDASKIFKDFRVTETMGLADVAKLTKAMKVAEALSASDASKLLKSIIQSDTVHLADSRTLTKVLKVAEAFGVSDVTKLSKVLKSIESIALSDASKLVKSLRTSDAIHPADSSKLSKDIKRADTISVADAPKLGKDIHTTQGVGVSDSTRLSKDLHGPESIGVADSIGHLDKDFRTADGVHLADLNSLLKAFFSAEFIQVNDVGLLHKAFLIQESLTVDDAVALTKAIMVVEAIYLEELLELTGKVDWIYSLEGVVRERIDSLEGQVLEVAEHMEGGVTLEKYLEGLIDDEI